MSDPSRFARRTVRYRPRPDRAGQPRSPPRRCCEELHLAPPDRFRSARPDTPFRVTPVSNQAAVASPRARRVTTPGRITVTGRSGSLEASRAVLGAIPLLHQSDRVSIFSAPQYRSEGTDPADLAESLQQHRAWKDEIGSNDGLSFPPRSSGRELHGSSAD
jgi:hypothetical protein